MVTERDLGIEALKRGDSATAVQHLQRACQAEPRDYRIFLYLGAAYGELQRMDEAVRALQAAAAIQPDAAPVQYNLGIALERAGRFPEAAAALEAAVALQPGYPKAAEALQRVRASVPMVHGYHAMPAAPLPPPVSVDDFVLTPAAPATSASSAAVALAPDAGLPPIAAVPGIAPDAPSATGPSRAGPAVVVADSMWTPAAPDEHVQPWQRAAVQSPQAYPVPGAAPAASYSIPTTPQPAPAARGFNWGPLVVGVGALAATVILAVIWVPLLKPQETNLDQATGGVVIQDSRRGVTVTLPNKFPQPLVQEGSGLVGEEADRQYAVKPVIYRSSNGTGECVVAVHIFSGGFSGEGPQEVVTRWYEKLAPEEATAQHFVLRSGASGTHMHRFERDHAGEKRAVRVLIRTSAQRVVLVWFGTYRLGILGKPAIEGFFSSLKLQ